MISQKEEIGVSGNWELMEVKMKFKFKSVKLWVTIISITIMGFLMFAKVDPKMYKIFADSLKWFVGFYVFGNVVSKFTNNKRGKR